MIGKVVGHTTDESGRGRGVLERDVGGVVHAENEDKMI